MASSEDDTDVGAGPAKSASPAGGPVPTGAVATWHHLSDAKRQSKKIERFEAGAAAHNNRILNAQR